ncbi:sigma54 specific transcriptional regulator, Fis family [Pseudodesulfovibrio mercurii]|uniref:Sigma54 specific transcriptional regulator, Fis family n=1 Tax=Pseudodesulfovibrio mercurii TaxID=641491 RepID=F0JDM3_9BACT|nr:sigma 54-interacting transcriptional regulator [Pseudodesulfovibrio mercurii]EGB14555.1 sigma54 specific transcriptional regulator, Fis family [Pseudodesulfovibrio mercurii]
MEVNVENVPQDLWDISGAATQYAAVISRVLRVDVEIVDGNLYRVAGTGRFASLVGKQMSSASGVYRQVLKTGRPLVIREPGFSEFCADCPNWQACDETFEMSTPILYQGTVVGVIGFVCFTEEQKAHIQDNFEVFFDFLAQMADILASKVVESMEFARSRALGQLLETVVDKVDEGVLLLAKDGRIVRSNRAAQQILDFPLEGQDAITVRLKRGENRLLQYTEYTVSLLGRSHDVAGNEYRLQHGESSSMFMFRDAQLMHDDALRLASSHERLGLDAILGTSDVIVTLKEQVARFADSNSSVLVTGESGTGKELVARALNEEGGRKEGPFVAINCGAIPETLLESELFGYVGGAFTGANPKGKMGRFEQANTGTLFLDEIGDMPLHLQAKLLRALEQREVTRLGSTQPTAIDVRVVSATNRNLEEMVHNGTFREDLYYRLNVIPIHIPPLRERPRDIHLLSKVFLEQSMDRLDKEILTIKESFWTAVSEYHWPGNVRELQNSIEYVANVVDSPAVITRESLPLKVRSGARESEYADYNLETMERTLIQQALKAFGDETGTKAAKERVANKLGIGIATLYRKIKRYGLE